MAWVSKAWRAFTGGRAKPTDQMQLSSPKARKSTLNATGHVGEAQPKSPRKRPSALILLGPPLGPPPLRGQPIPVRMYESRSTPKAADDSAAFTTAAICT
mmetsp:Transcript_2261/g.4119  ORF Transcript_2261/g.4119 Transcript_2261/m.4119 type:complete len:100 (-) Transcript_2261:65-364(-)